MTSGDRREFTVSAESRARIVVGVGAGIAAYKAVTVVRLLTNAGHTVTVVPTPEALNFVGAATWEAISGNSVATSVFDAVPEVGHVRIGHDADLVVVVPATADVMARAATGTAGDLLTATLLMATCPIVFVPAMHTQMWLNAATQANVATLRSRGCEVMEPANGQLTGGDIGAGRLPEPAEIYAYLESILSRASRHDLSATRVLVTAGGTREPLDPVRFLSNRSSGRQGVALAEAARDRGADVTLVCANLEVPQPFGVTAISVESARDMERAVMECAADMDIIVMAAAVADYRPQVVSETKIKKSSGDDRLTVEFIRNPDILAGVIALQHQRQIVVGFAAETGSADADVLSYGQQKARAKRADLLAVNEVGVRLGFGSTMNNVTFLDRSGAVQGSASGSKREVADSLFDAVLRLDRNE